MTLVADWFRAHTEINPNGCMVPGLPGERCSRSGPSPPPSCGRSSSVPGEYRSLGPRGRTWRPPRAAMCGHSSPTHPQHGSFAHPRALHPPRPDGLSIFIQSFNQTMVSVPILRPTSYPKRHPVVGNPTQTVNTRNPGRCRCASHALERIEQNETSATGKHARAGLTTGPEADRGPTASPCLAREQCNTGMAAAGARRGGVEWRNAGELARRAAWSGDIARLSSIVAEFPSMATAKGRLDGSTPAHWACLSGHGAVLRLLVQLGCTLNDLSASDSRIRGQTPLH